MKTEKENATRKEVVCWLLAAGGLGVWVLGSGFWVSGPLGSGGTLVMTVMTKYLVELVGSWSDE